MHIKVKINFTLETKETGEAKLATSAEDKINMDNQYKTLDSGELSYSEAPEANENVVRIFMFDFGKNILRTLHFGWQMAPSSCFFLIKPQKSLSMRWKP